MERNIPLQTSLAGAGNGNFHISRQLTCPPGSLISADPTERIHDPQVRRFLQLDTFTDNTQSSRDYMVGSLGSFI